MRNVSMFLVITWKNSFQNQFLIKFVRIVYVFFSARKEIPELTFSAPVVVFPKLSQYFPQFFNFLEIFSKSHNFLEDILEIYFELFCPRFAMNIELTSTLAVVDMENLCSKSLDQPISVVILDKKTFFFKFWWFFFHKLKKNSIVNIRSKLRCSVWKNFRIWGF